MRRDWIVLFHLILFLGLSACGQAGPLYLPQTEKQHPHDVFLIPSSHPGSPTYVQLSRQSPAH